MKGFAKIIELEDRDVLVKKTYNDDEERHEIQFEAYVDGINLTFNVGMISEEARDRKFDEVDESVAKGAVQYVLGELKRNSHDTQATH